MWLLFAKEVDARREGAAIVAAERQKLWRVDVGVDNDWIGGASEVVEAAAQRPVIAKEVEALFQLQVQREISWEPVGAGRGRCDNRWSRDKEYR